MVSSWSSVVPSAVVMEVISGFPCVIVPVLSRTTMPIFSAAWMASMSRMRMPRRAPLPVATMMAAGMANPRAQGQAMISTEQTALARADQVAAADQ